MIYEAELRTHVSEGALKNILQWLTDPKYAAYKPALEEMIAGAKWQELEDGFFKVLEFGTAGRRGTVGLGPNRINKITIGESAQALCQYALSVDRAAGEKGVVIACDTRLSSPELSEYSAMVCAANGFKTYIFDSFRSTPELSFALRHLECAVGIVISASHNPPEDNGFKAYWSDGAQIVAPHDRGVMATAASIGTIQALGRFEEGVENGQIQVIGDSVDDAYIEAVLSQSESSERALSIVYSPLHGAGQTNVLPVLRESGFQNIQVIEEQMVPDGNFPTISNGKPNPEEEIANAMTVKKLIDSSSDIGITNDPDADRIGIIVNHHEKPYYLNGNQSAILAADFCLSKMEQKGILTGDHYLAKTIVTTDMINALGKKYDVKIYDNMLIGFKYIGELIKSKEGTAETFVLGCEESYGMLKGDYARDKDGASGALCLAEHAAELKQADKTLVDRLMELYVEHGLYREISRTVAYPGAQGFHTMQAIMKSLRTDPPREIRGVPVSKVLDYQSLVSTDLGTGETEQIDCVSGNVLVLELGTRDRRITIRPSGTEPKLKYYLQWHESTQEPYAKIEEIDAFLVGLFDELSTEATSRI